MLSNCSFAPTPLRMLFLRSFSHRNWASSTRPGFLSRNVVQQMVLHKKQQSAKESSFISPSSLKVPMELHKLLSSGATPSSITNQDIRMQRLESAEEARMFMKQLMLVLIGQDCALDRIRIRKVFLYLEFFRKASWANRNGSWILLAKCRLCFFLVNCSNEPHQCMRPSQTCIRIFMLLVKKIQHWTLPIMPCIVRV